MLRTGIVTERTVVVVDPIEVLLEDIASIFRMGMGLYRKY